MGLIEQLRTRAHHRPFAKKIRGWRPRASRVHGPENLEGRVLMHAGTTPAPVHDNPVLEAEHQAVFNLVPHSAATHTAVQNGDWDDPATWDHGIPTVGANVLIPKEFTVQLDSVQRDVLRTLRIDGTLNFAPTINTGLVVDTMIVASSGSLLMGTALAPIAPDVEAKIIIGDYDPANPTDRHWDPQQFSRGLISHGTVSMFGAETTSFVALAQAPRQGETTLVLDGPVVGWEAGDRLILTGTNANRKEDEELTIVSVDGNRVTVDRPLAFNHLAPEGMAVFVANVSRNVVVESQNPFDNAERGHVMFMHKPWVDVNYAGFYGLGRTDKRNPLHNVILDAEGHAVDGTGKNVAGRYAVHFHRTGLDHDQAPAEVRGSAVVDSPGWGFVNHGSHVEMVDNVAFDVVGAAFVTETGDEIGAFRHNIAIRSEGSGNGIESRQDRQDFGHQGDGFWFQGAGIEVEGNVAVGQRHAGFVYFTRGLEQKGLGTTRFLSHNLADSSIAGGKETIDVGSVPIRLFKDNTAFASATGFESWFHQLNAGHTSRSVVEGFKSWNTSGNAMFTPYTNQMTIKDSILLGNVAAPRGTAINRNDVTRNITYQNLTVVGWNVGISVPVNGHTVIDGGRFSNVRSLSITTANSRDRVVDIRGDVRFVPLATEALKGQTQYDIFLKSNFNPKERDITRMFNPDVIRLGTVRYNGKQLYYPEQASNFVPFKVGEAASYIPKELLGLTNQQMWDRYGLAIGGIVAPANAFTDPKIRGLIGDPANYLPDLKLVSAKYSNVLTGYRLVYRDAAGTKITDPTPVNLRAGWNLITRRIGGNLRTFLVYGDVTAPTFQIDPKQTLRINPLDLREGIVIRGKILDDSFGSKSFHKRFSNLDLLPQFKRADGSVYVVVKFTIKDLAGNKTEVALQVTIDPKAPLQMDIGFKKLPPRQVSETLLALLGFKEDKLV
jgi:hypothetical protein